jgi:nickel transport protein
MKKIFFSIIVVAILIFPISLFSHGVDIVLINGGTGIEARYDSGDPIVHADVIVYSPESKKYDDPFQVGITDRNGRFLFFPDADGKWKVVVNDGTGHGGTKYIIINDSSIVQDEAIEKPAGRSIKILSGIMVIFGLTGILFFALARRDRKRSVDAHS